MSTSPLEALGQVLAEVSAASRQQTQVLQALMDRAEATGGMSSMKRMVEGEDPQTFLDVFEATATSCKWPEEEWSAKLLPLLVGEAQRAALSLPAAARMQYSNLRHAILDRVGSSPEEHRRKFRAMKLGPGDRPFVLAFQLRDAATRANGLDPKMLEAIVLEQFVEAIPARTSAWVRYHSPTDVKAAVKLAEEHLAVQREAETKTAEGPTPSPRRRLAPLWGGVEGAPLERRPRPAEPPGAREQGTGAAEKGLPSQMAPQTPGPVCWRCGRPGHVRRECSVMEVGQVMRVVGPPAPAPDRGGDVLCPGKGRWQPTEDFPLEQSRDETLREAWGQVDYIDVSWCARGKRGYSPIFQLFGIDYTEWAVTLKPGRNTPSCWCQNAAGKWFSRRRILIPCLAT
ncbi:uncharacterized protein LOC133634961 [Entelurus aequoreus]|uniref:uncharacterized protein LOC133634961 n=1 Tax=Entelurus aequoreus TaxID=161455 RepID=UPI002B1D2E6E|nr:uncharacterized protein LOC133634961 [Entelurus aequoreus]